MGTKSINTVLNFKEKMSTGVNTASKSTKNLKNSTKQAERQIKKFRNSAKRSYKDVTKSVKKLAIAGTGLATAYLGLNAMRDSADAAKAQIEAETKLEAIMKNVKGVTASNVKELKQHASALQNVGVIGDEVTLAAMAQLSTFQLQSDSVKQLSEGMLDLLANNKGLNATQQDAQSIGNLVGKVMQGQVGALSKSGISFTKAQEKILKFGNEQEKAATLAQVLKENVGGVNKALANQDLGSIQQMTNMWGDLKEVVGVYVLKALAKFSKWFKTKIPGIQEDFLETKDRALEIYEVFSQKWAQIQPVVKRVKEEVVELKNDAFEFYKVIKENWSTIEPYVFTLIGAFGAYKAAMVVLKIKTLAYAAAEVVKTGVLATGATTVNAMTIAQWALNKAMTANPVGLIIAGLTALVVAGIAVYQNWDTIKAKAFELWEGVKSAFAPATEFFSNLWLGITTGIDNMIAKIKGAFDTSLGVIKGTVKGYANVFTMPINHLIDGINRVKIDVPDWVPSIGGKKFGFDIPKIPAFQLGTPYFKGGLAQINEKGGEVVDLPNGSRVYPADKSEKMMGSRGGDINVHIHGDVYGDEAFVNMVGNRIARKIKLAMMNM